MKLPIGDGVELTYCLNVHPGATMDELRVAAFESAPNVFRNLKSISGVEGPYGVGLWFSGETAKLLSEGDELKRFADQLSAAGVYCFTLNGFPYGKFHGARVKDEVYLPDWSDPERLAHTKRLARCLQFLLRDDGTGSISTVPVGYINHLSEEMIETAVANIAAMAVDLHQLEKKTGSTIRLALEPEPDCLLEDLPSAVDFFENRLWKKGVDHLASECSVDCGRAREIMDRHVGLCIDTIHVGVAFERPAETIRELVRRGIPIHKIQLGSALRSRQSGSASPALSSFTDETYLHQTRVANEGRVAKYLDLPAALEAGVEGDWRVHYHVPLIWDGDEDLMSTRDDLDVEAFNAAVFEAKCPHFEVETYTLELFPDKSEPDDMILARELAWVFNQFSLTTPLRSFCR